MKASSILGRNTAIFLGALIATFACLRLWLAFAPNSDLNVGGYNIHHLFTGLLIATIGGVPLAILDGSSRGRDLARAIFGIGLGMALDEWVYLIATDGTNASYLLPVSLWGGVAVIGIASIYTLAIFKFGKKCRPSPDTTGV